MSGLTSQAGHQEEATFENKARRTTSISLLGLDDTAHGQIARKGWGDKLGVHDVMAEG